MIIIYGKNLEHVNAQLFTMFFDRKLTYLTYDKNDEEIFSHLFQNSLLGETNTNEVYVIEGLHHLKEPAFKKFVAKLLTADKEIVIPYVTTDVNLFYDPLFYKNKKVQLVNTNRFGSRNLQQFAFDLSKTYPISFDCETTKNTFIASCTTNPQLIYHEVIKLHNYSLTKAIDANTLELLTHQVADDNVFNLTVYILKNQKQQALQLFNNLLNSKRGNTINLIGAVANSLFSLKLLLEAKYVYQTSNPSVLASKLNLHPYVVQNQLNLLSNVSLKTLNNMLNNLFNIDYNIKSYLVIDEIAFKEFILKDYTNGR